MPGPDQAITQCDPLACLVVLMVLTPDHDVIGRVAVLDFPDVGHPVLVTSPGPVDVWKHGNKTE